MKRRIYLLIVMIFLAATHPLDTYAQGPGTYFGNVFTFLTDFRTVVNLAVNVVLVLAFLFFLWGLTKFIFAAGDESKIEEGKRIMVWGIVALFVMFSVWGIITFLQITFGVGDGQPLLEGIDNVFPNPDTA